MEVTNNLTLAGAGSLTMGSTYTIIMDNIVNINGSGSITLNGPSNSSSTLPGTLTIAGSGNFNMGPIWVLQLTGLNLSGTGSVRATSNTSSSVIQVFGAITETGSGLIDLSFGSTSDNRIEFMSGCISTANLQLQTRN